MTKSLKKLFLFLLFFLPYMAKAHEVYVLDWDQVALGLTDRSVNPFMALRNEGNMTTVLMISAGILIGLIIFFFLQHSSIGRRMGNWISSFKPLGFLALRLAVGAGFVFSAYNGNFLGPELVLSAFPAATIFQALLLIAGVLIFLGIFTRIAALIAIIIFLVAGYVYGFYVLTYFGYVGALITFLFFDSPYLSLDRFFFNQKRSFVGLLRYENLIIRIGFATTLIYSAVYVKFIHAILSLQVVNQYNITKYSYLFPHDPLLVVLGACLTEITLGLFIIFGFQIRLTVLVSLFYLTLSLFFFNEPAWPHYILFGLALFLFFVPPYFSLDNFIDRKMFNRQKS